jgi:hypothetical protein
MISRLTDHLTPPTDPTGSLTDKGMRLQEPAEGTAGSPHPYTQKPSLYSVTMIASNLEYVKRKMMQNLDSYMIPCLETHSHTFIYYLI